MATVPFTSAEWLPALRITPRGLLSAGTLQLVKSIQILPNLADSHTDSAIYKVMWQPVGESNPSYLVENQVS